MCIGGLANQLSFPSSQGLVHRWITYSQCKGVFLLVCLTDLAANIETIGIFSVKSWISGFSLKSQMIR